MHIRGWCKQFGRFSLYTTLSQLSELYEKHLEISQSGHTESDSRSFMDHGGKFHKRNLIFSSQCPMDPHSLGSGKEWILVAWIKVNHLLSHTTNIVNIPRDIIDLDRLVGIQELKAPRTSRKSVHEGGKFVCPTHQPPLPPGNIPDTNFR